MIDPRQRVEHSAGPTDWVDVQIAAPARLDMQAVSIKPVRDGFLVETADTAVRCETWHELVETLRALLLAEKAT